MSFKAQKWAWEQKTKTPLTQILLFAIAQAENDEKGYAWCSHQYLADKCRCSRRAIIQNLGYLESENYINIKRQTKDGIKTTNHYSVNYSRCERDAHHDVNEVHKGSERGSHGGSERGSHKQITSFNRLINTNPESDFDQWYAEYPIKKGRKTALASWLKAKNKPDLQTMLTILQSQKEQDDNWQRDFIPHPTTYLNQERWTDEIQQPKRGELTEADKYELRQRREAAIVQELNGHDVGNDVAALPPAMDEDEWRDRWSGVSGLVS